MRSNPLVMKTLKTALLGAVALGLLLFLPAGTLAYWQAWLFMIVFTVSTNAIGVYLMVENPELLERRMKVGPAAEERIEQKIIISLILLGFIALPVFCSLDHRFGWSSMPPFVSLAGNILVVLGLLISFFALRANSYGSSTIRVLPGQEVISTGPYALIRHPMYFGALVMMAGIPPALGSWWGLLAVALNLPLLVWRILDEERLLEKDLPGYVEYEKKVRYRLFPYLW